MNIYDMPKLSAAERGFLASGDKIAAIKAYRMRTGYGLKDSKDACDNPHITGKTGLDVMLDQIGVVFIKAHLVSLPGTDLVILHTTLPCPFSGYNPADADAEPGPPVTLQLKFECPKGTGERYCRMHFGITAEPA